MRSLSMTAFNAEPSNKCAEALERKLRIEVHILVPRNGETSYCHKSCCQRM